MNAPMELASLLIDEARMAALLQERLPGYREGGWRILGCELAQTRRRISRRVREQGSPWLGLVWRLSVLDLTSGEAGEQWLYAKAYSRGASLSAWREGQPAACARPRFGTPIEHLAELDLVIWALPNDPRLEQLPGFVDAPALRAHLPPGVAPGEDEALQVRIVRHEPEEHCTVRYECRRGGALRAFYGKCYVDDAGWRDARDGLAALWRQSEADPAAFRVGRPLGASPALKAIWQQEVFGTPLAERLAGPQSGPALAALARALLRLQAGGPRQGALEDPTAALAVAGKWRKKLVQAQARFAAPADAVLALLERLPARPAAAVTVHGDCHAGQMLWSEGRIALFDYDNFALGSPARDLADFISQWLCEPGAGQRAARQAAELLANYRAQAAQPPAADEFEWQLRLMLMRKAYSFFVRHRLGWPERVEHALTLARAGLATLEAASHGDAA